jgi:hypothetical protein
MTAVTRRSRLPEKIIAPFYVVQMSVLDEPKSIPFITDLPAPLRESSFGRISYVKHD